MISENRAGDILEIMRLIRAATRDNPIEIGEIANRLGVTRREVSGLMSIVKRTFTGISTRAVLSKGVKSTFYWAE